ncbi:glyceraldehyde-3-phosphate dehydrogenase [Moraxella haemolytica]|uniref:type I glyceraldehyde-3-phosphate dehydrogenase n=1 Tax=Moraxella haemolytica TaxID=2904119 RepID=UPI002542998D|nr:type I glyceraldehyde-3-phosphate dehydrogenase [Moraxella sp. ZY171148]WII94775.1 glyceraldehyde-3-phosphate dehydrogenase [Moraxella sp. ZY171148]
MPESVIKSPKLRLAINGFGRIGRNVLRAFLRQSERFSQIEIVAINDIADGETLLHLLKFDSTHGRLLAMGVQADLIEQGGQSFFGLRHQDKHWQILLLNESNPNHLPWGSLGVDVVLECTGCFRSYDEASRHRKAGAHQVIVGAAPFDRVDASIVMGVNESLLGRHLPIISGVSCTTQALVPLLSVFDEQFGIDAVMMTEIHAVTADQNVLDQAHRDLRRARTASNNIIPTTSSSINATERVLPFLKGRINGHSIRVPTINVAAIDVNITVGQAVNVETVAEFLRQTSQDRLLGIMGYTDEPLVSSDFIGDNHSLVIDGGQLMQAGRQIKIFAWYDNEWGYANRLLEICAILAKHECLD